MSKIVNLKQMRKQKARADKRKAGDANAARFGRTGAEQRLTEAQLDKAKQDLDGHKRE